MNANISRDYRYVLPTRATMRGLEGSSRRISLAAIASTPPANYLHKKTLDRFPALARWAEQTGATAMIEIPGSGNGGRILAKMEIENPTGSISDRDALYMLQTIQDSAGKSEKIPHILCPADPDLALSLAVLSARLEIGCTLVMKAGTPKGLIATLKYHGAVIHLADDDSLDAARQKAATLHRQHPEWHRPDLQSKAALRQLHIRTTAREIIRQVKALSGTTTPAALIMAPEPRETFTTIATTLKKYAGKIGRKLSIIEASVSGTSPARGGQGITAIRLSPEQCEQTIHDFHARSGLWISPSTAACLHAARHATAGLARYECVVTILGSLARVEEVAALAEAEPAKRWPKLRESAGALRA